MKIASHIISYQYNSYFYTSQDVLCSVLWRCWLGGVLVWLSVWSTVQTWKFSPDLTHQIGQFLTEFKKLKSGCLLEHNLYAYYQNLETHLTTSQHQIQQLMTMSIYAFQKTHVEHGRIRFLISCNTNTKRHRANMCSNIIFSVWFFIQIFADSEFHP